jgi:DNA-binding PadR family transcriptional regulator
MALEGNLSAFGLSEILQLISVQQKTGMLTVSGQDSNAVLFFRDGMIISTRDRRRKAKDPFKEFLTRYGILSREELIRITQISSQSKLDLLDILVSEGFMPEEELRKYFQKQIQESLHEVLTWDNCSYKFISNEDVVKGIRSVGDFSIEGMLMESMRRIDEFPRMLEMFPHDRILIKRVDDADEVEDVEKMTANERAVLELLHENTSLRDLIARARLPLFEVYESLKLLHEKGLIETKDEQPQVVENITPRAKKAAARARRNAIPFFAAAVLFSATLFLGIHGFVQNFDTHREAVIESIESNSIARNQVAENLRWLLEAYRAQHGVYPPSLSALEDAGLATPRIMAMTKLFDIRYQLTPGRPAYTLL